MMSHEEGRREARCRCLNVSVQLAKLHDVYAVDVPAFKELRRATLNPLGGVTMVHPSLAETVADAVSGWDCSPDIKIGDDISETRKSSDYSETFGIVLFNTNQPNAGVGAAETGVFETIETTYRKYVETQKQLTQEAIKKENALLQEKLAKAQREHAKLLLKLRSHKRTPVKEQTLTSPYTQTAAQVSPIPSVTNPAAPHTDVLSSSSRSSTTSRKVHFVESPQRPQDDDDMFELDEDASTSPQKKYIDDDHLDVDPDPVIQGSLLSSSIPIGIPQFGSYREDIAREQAEDGEDFVAPHLIVAKSFTMSESLSGRPSPRKASLAI
ncbi:hypothetical protein BC829DRAFT_481886 [Chytridium lagenaria]|nr:hypothetical protein BC829DRAFT_481886 [Chytridium lagenaria]